MSQAGWVFAYIDEPPFALPGARGCDVELALAGLAAIGIGPAQTVLTTFGELLPGLQDGRWQMTTAMFITPQRAELVDFSRPVWALGDGLVVRKEDAVAPRSLQEIARRGLRLAVVRGQVQRQAAERAGVRDAQFRVFEAQEPAVAAVLAGEADAYISTAVGNRSYVAATAPDRLEVADLEMPGGAPLGGFAFAKSASYARTRFDAWLAGWLGGPAHRALAARWGLGAWEIEPALPNADALLQAVRPLRGTTPKPGFDREEANRRN